MMATKCPPQLLGKKTNERKKRRQALAKMISHLYLRLMQLLLSVAWRESPSETLLACGLLVLLQLCVCVLSSDIRRCLNFNLFFALDALWTLFIGIW